MIYTKEFLKNIKLNFHFSMFCNMRCKFCFYEALIKNAKPTRNLSNWLEIINKVSFFKAINFAGGEPTLFWDELKAMAQLCQKLNLKATLITNGSVFLKKSTAEVQDLLQYFNSVGLSVDSIATTVNLSVGRAIGNKKELSKKDYQIIAKKIKQSGCELKINTVVHAYNKNLKLLRFIKKVKPVKWKIMQVSYVEQKLHKNLTISKTDFLNFLKINKVDKKSKFIKSVENEETVTSSYVMIDGEGYFYNSDQINSPKTSRSILENDVDILKEFNKCNFDLAAQLKRYQNEKK